MNFELDQHQAIMRFSVNGSDQGVAFRVAKSEFAGRALFPHVLTKNQVIVPFAGPVVLFQLGIQEFSPICSSITGWVWRKPTIMTHENFNFTISSGLHCELWSNAWSPLPSWAGLHPNWPTGLCRWNCQVIYAWKCKLHITIHLIK